MALDKITTGIIADDVSISTSGAITTTGAFTSVGIDDNASGATAITIDANENVGIGVTNPSDFNDSINNLVVGSIASGAHGITIATHSTSTGYLSFADGATTAADEYRGLIEYDHSANTMHLRTDAAQRLTIDSSGNVGIGVTPRTDWRDTRTGLQIGPRTTLWGESGNNNSVFGHNVYETSSGYAGIANGACTFFLMSAGEMNYRNGTNSAGAGGTVTMTTRFAIAANGNASLGHSGSVHPTIRFQIKGASNSSADYSFFSEGSSSNLFYCRNDGYIWAASTINIGSDERMKENINYITDDVLPKINQLKLSKFDYIEGQNDQYGFIAQDVEEVFPEFVNDGGAIGSVAGEYKTLTYDFLFSHSLKAIQELSAKNDALEAKITALENA